MSRLVVVTTIVVRDELSIVVMFITISQFRIPNMNPTNIGYILFQFLMLLNITTTISLLNHILGFKNGT